MNAIEIKNAIKSYPDFSLQVSMAVPQGSIVGLVGENGAGKSTLIKMIMGVVGYDGGSVSVLGHDNRAPEFRAVKDDIGIVTDEACFPETLTAKEVNSVMKNIYSRWDKAYYAQLLRRFSLPEKKLFKEFSRGMKMKLAIAACLAHHPRLLLLDEATGGLDPLVRDEILDVFSEITREEDHAVLMSSHIVSDLEKVCDYIAFLHHGRLLLFEEKDRLSEQFGIVRMTRQERDLLPQSCIRAEKETTYGVEVLVDKRVAPSGLCYEHSTLEELILLMVREEKRA